jgi:integrase
MKALYYKDVSADKNSLAAKADVNPRTLTGLLNGGKTTLAIAEKVAATLDTTVSKMFQAEGKATGLHPKTIVEHHRLIHAILNRGVKWQVVTSNIADRAEPPKVIRTEAESYNEEQVLHLLDAIDSEPTKYQIVVYLGAFGGLRAGEMTGLEWSDIDFDNCCLSVNRARQYLSGMNTFDKAPKTEKSKRTIEMPQIAIDMLRRHKKEQAATRLKLGSKWIHSNKVLTQGNGLPMNPQTPSQWFNKFLGDNGLPHITLHQLRHTHVSLLLANGVDIATISKRVGHARISTTLDVYSHAIRSKDRAAADKLDELALGKQGNSRYIDDI